MLSAKSTSRAEKIIVGILAHIFVRIVGISKVLLITQLPMIKL